MNLDIITPVILTYDEEANIDFTLEALTDFKEVIVVDSFSNDKTLLISSGYENVTLYQRKFDEHASQWNFGLEKATNNWIFALDADYLVPKNLLSEIESINLVPDVGYAVEFKFVVFDRALSKSILPSRVVLFNKKYASYYQDGHTQRLEIVKTNKLKNVIYHCDRKEIDRWLWAQKKYCDLEVTKLSTGHRLRFSDQVRKLKVFAPFVVFFICFFLKGGLFNGKRGIYYCFQRLYLETLISLKLLDSELRNEK